MGQLKIDMHWILGNKQHVHEGSVKGVPTLSVKRQRPIQVNGDFSQASTQASSSIFDVWRLPLGVFMPLLGPGFLVWGITEQDIILASSVCAL